MAKEASGKKDKKTISIKAITPFMWFWMIITALICLLLLPNTMDTLNHNMSDPIYIYRAFISFSILLINTLPICFIITRYQRKSIGRFCLVRGVYFGWVGLSLVGQKDILGVSQIASMMGLALAALDFYACYYFFASEKAKKYFVETSKKKNSPKQ